MAEIILTDPRQMYAHTVRWVRDAGEKVEVRDLLTREVRGVTLIIPDPTHPVLPIGTGRKINTRFAAVEALGLVAGVARGDLLDVAAPGWRDVLVDPDAAELGAYGPRTRGQLNSAYVILRDDPTSRRVVMTIWRPVDLYANGDRPCTLTLQFLLRDSGLELHTTMRSQDVFLGLAYDLFVFTQLQLTLARWLGVPAGALIHHVGSFHLYERDLPAVDDLWTTPRTLEEPLPQGIVSATTQQTPPEAAQNLLSPSPSGVVLQENPWYARQIQRIREAMR